MRLLLTASLLAACAEDPPSGPNVNSFVEYYDFPGYLPSNLDVLVVVDDSTAMAPHQSALDGLPAALAMVVEEIYSMPDIRIGVTTANGEGVLRPAGTESFVALSYDARLVRTPNFTGTVTDALTSLLDVGAASSSTAQPLGSIKAALDATPSFVRSNAYLAVITIAAGDDASSMSVAEYVSDLKGRKGDPASIVVAGIYDVPSARLDAFHEAFPNRNEVSEIASVDFTAALYQLLQINRSVLGVPCMREPADVDATTPGPQYDCDLNAYYADGTSEPMRQCTPEATGPCFELESDPQACVDSGYKRFVVKGYASMHRPPVRGQCVVAE